jgi:hypothetical protein
MVTDHMLDLTRSDITCNSNLVSKYSPFDNAGKDSMHDNFGQLFLSF